MCHLVTENAMYMPSDIHSHDELVDIQSPSKVVVFLASIFPFLSIVLYLTVDCTALSERHRTLRDHFRARTRLGCRDSGTFGKNNCVRVCLDFWFTSCLGKMLPFKFVCFSVIKRNAITFIIVKIRFVNEICH